MSIVPVSPMFWPRNPVSAAEAMARAKAETSVRQRLLNAKEYLELAFDEFETGSDASMFRHADGWMREARDELGPVFQSHADPDLEEVFTSLAEARDGIRARRAVEAQGAIHDALYGVTRVLNRLPREQNPVLSHRRRERLPDSAFAYPEQRKLPIIDDAHVRNALARFPRTSFASRAAQARAAKRILAEAARRGIAVSPTSAVARSVSNPTSDSSSGHVERRVAGVVNPTFARHLRELHGSMGLAQEAVDQEDKEELLIGLDEAIRSVRSLRSWYPERGPRGELLERLEVGLERSQGHLNRGDWARVGRELRAGMHESERFIGGAAVRSNPHHRHHRRARRTRRNPDTLFTVLLMAAALVAGVALSRYGVVEQLLPGDLERRLFPGTT